MKHLCLNSARVKGDDFSLIKKSLMEGQVLVLLTDTIYGLSCLVNERRALRKICLLKRRTEPKAFIVLVKSLASIMRYAYLSKRQRAIIQKNHSQSKRPTTFILKSRGNLPSELSGGRDTLAFRLPKSDFLIKILKSLKLPLVSTSLNISGRAPLNDPRLISDYFKSRRLWPDLVIDSGYCRRRRPSRVLDLTVVGPGRIVRS